MGRFAGAWWPSCAAGAPNRLLMELVDHIACIIAIYDNILCLNSTTIVWWSDTTTDKDPSWTLSLVGWIVNLTTTDMDWFLVASLFGLHLS